MTEGEISALERDGIAEATGRLMVRAPFTGEILNLHAVRGEQVESGGEIILLGDTRTLWVWVDLYEDHLAGLDRAGMAEGAPVEIAVRACPNESFKGTVDFVSRVMDETSRTVKARISLDNPDGRLRPGMFATVSITALGGSGLLAIPTSAVLSDDGRDFVFVRYLENYFVRRAVVKGLESDGFVEILDGLQPEQLVVVDGAFLLKSDVLREKMGAGCAD